MFFVDLLEHSLLSLSFLFQNLGWGTASLYSITSQCSEGKKNIEKHTWLLKLLPGRDIYLSSILISWARAKHMAIPSFTHLNQKKKSWDIYEYL